MPSTPSSDRQPCTASPVAPDNGPPARAAAALAHPFVTALALVLVALNLRPALSSLAPVLCLGLFGFIAPRLTDRFGAERTVVGALLVLAAGIALRGIPAFPSLFAGTLLAGTLLAGTLLAGAGIGVAGVLLPSLVKRDFPHQASLMTGVYTMALCTGAATAAGLTVPLADWLDSWPAALAFWALPALAVALLWLPRATPRQSDARTERYRVTGLWRDPLAWQVTLFMGLQSSLAYIVFGWLAPILRDRGLDPVIAGAAVSASIMVQISTALTAPIIAGRRPSQSGAAAVLIGLTLAGLLGCLYAPLGTLWLWIVILGLGQGGVFAVALSLIVLRAPNAQVATHLSGMAQSVGYTLAAVGPLLAGLLHDWTGSWDASGGLFAAICLLAIVFGVGAGRALHVNATTRPL